MTAPKENDLAAALQRGEAHALESVLEQFGPRLRATARRILGQDADAEDALQDALLSIWKNASAFAGASSLYTWMHRIVVNASLARLRQRASVSTASAPADEDRSFLWENLAATRPEEVPAERQVALAQALQRALAQIPLEWREVLLLRDVEGFSSQDVAATLDLTDATVRQRLHRARHALAEFLRPELCTGRELTCGGDLDLLQDELDGILSGDLLSAVQGHIAACPGCQSMRDVYVRILRAPLMLESVPGPGTRNASL
ncbi:MAG: hypothetical protein OHK0021_04830 [Bryobacter sp.]